MQVRRQLRGMLQRVCGMMLAGALAVAVVGFSATDERKTNSAPAASCELEANECAPPEERVFALKYQI